MNLVSHQRESYVLRQTPIIVVKEHRQGGYRQCTPESVPGEVTLRVHFRIAGKDALTLLHIHEEGGRKKRAASPCISHADKRGRRLRRTPVPERAALICTFRRGEREKWLYLGSAVGDGQHEETRGKEGAVGIGRPNWP